MGTRCLLARACRKTEVTGRSRCLERSAHALALRDEFASDAEWKTNVDIRAAALFVAMLTEREAGLRRTGKHGEGRRALVGRYLAEVRLIGGCRLHKCRMRALLRRRRLALQIRHAEGP